MRYLEFRDSREEIPESDEKSRWVKCLEKAAGWILGKIVPKANPDLEPLYEEVEFWWLELDETGEPNREIGFDRIKTPIVLGPIGENYGVLVDAGSGWEDTSNDSEEVAQRFDNIWDELFPQFATLESKSANSSSLHATKQTCR